MKLKIIIIITGTIALGIVALIYILSLFLKNDSQTSTPLPIPTPASTFMVVSSSITDGQTNVPLDSEISIKFNRPINASSVSISILPTTEYAFNTLGDTITITPLSLRPSTLYSLSMSYSPTNELMASFVFTTLGPTPTLLPDTRPSEEPENTDGLLLQTRPDVYLSNKLPYSQNGFSADYTFVTSPTGHFAFIITLSGDRSSSREAFLSWVRSVGLNDSQIQSLDITYN